MRAPITGDELRDAIQRLHQAFPKFGLSSETMPQIVRVYREALEDYDRECVDGAVRMLIRSTEKFPTPNAWREVCKTWLKHNRPYIERQTEEDRDGRTICCRTCRSVPRTAHLRRADGSEYWRVIAPCDRERHAAGDLIVPMPENFIRWSSETDKELFDANTR